MKTVYFISGLGADERVFKYLQLQNCEEKYIHWITPEKSEKLDHYCQRLLSQIDLTDEIILIGVSFGGIVAQEISKLIPVKKVIILSSIKSILEFDWQLSCVRKLKLYRLVPSRFLKWSNILTADYYFGIQTKDESALLHKIIKDTDRLFMKWAIAEIMNWKHNSKIPGLIHIHGEMDRIFPVKRLKNYHSISGGGHFMIVNRFREIKGILEKEIEKLT